MSKISPPDLDDRLSNGTEPYVLDIRPRKAYQRDHIDGSENVPVYGDLQRGDDTDLREAIADIPQDRTVVTVCKAGIVAREATSLLEDEGYDAVTLAGGMRRWNGYRNDSLGYRVSSLLRGNRS